MPKYLSSPGQAAASALRAAGTRMWTDVKAAAAFWDWAPWGTGSWLPPGDRAHG